MKSIIKKNNTPLPSVFAVPMSIKNTNVVTPETILLSPSPLRQVDSKPPFLIPSSTMAEADCITTAPLDLSDQEWPLLRNLVDPPPKLIPPAANHRPPNISNRQRKGSSRCSHPKAIESISSPNPPMSPSNTVTPSKPPSSLSTFDNVRPSCLESPPSPSTLNYDDVEPSCLELPLSPSTLNYDNVEPSCLESSPSPST